MVRWGEQLCVQFLQPEILAVMGCLDSDPARTTRDCHLICGRPFHGVNFHLLCDPDTPTTNTHPSQGITLARLCERQVLCVQGLNDRFSVCRG